MGLLHMARRAWESRLFSCLFALTVAGPLAAQVVAPPPPATFDAEIRFRIRATRGERYKQFNDMLRELEAAGFVAEPGAEELAYDPDAERLRGTLPSANLPQALAVPAIRSLLLTPAGAKLPADGTVPVRVRLTSGLPPEGQRALFEQTRDRLNRMGFVEKVGYDHHHFTLLFGSAPVRELTRYIADVRYEPSGWLSPDSNPDLLPEPLRSHSPVRVVEVVTGRGGLPVETDVPARLIDPALAKLSPELIAFLATEGATNKVTRFDVVLLTTPAPGETAWKRPILAAGNVAIEGVVGPLVSLLGPAGAARELAKLPDVASIRLPTPADPAIPSGGTIRPADALEATGLHRLHLLGGTGRGVRVAIIDGDFTAGKRLLSRYPNIRWIDLTAERNTTLLPDPVGDERPGRGTLAALAAMRAAPHAEFILVRVDPAAPHQLLTVARAIAGENYRSESLTARRIDLVADDIHLREVRNRLNAERAELANNFSPDEATTQLRKDMLAKLYALAKEEQAFSDRMARFTALETALHELRAVSVVACNLNWTEGFPVDGSSPLSLYLDGPAHLNERRHKLGPVAWLQAAGDTRHQAWAGPLWDLDGNGVFEFAPNDMPRPGGRWTRELNFVAWAPHDGEMVADLPAGLHVRLTLQWTEAHDPTAPVDPQRYHEPINKFRALVLHQRDPSGDQTSSDDLVVVGRSTDLPQLINRAANSATYEHVLDLVIEKAGRYAVRFEGQAAARTIPADVDTVPAAVKHGEVFPRLALTVTDPASRDAGRAVFVDYRSIAGGMGTPADAHATLAIGGADATGTAQPYSARGSAPSLALLPKPTYLAFDEFEFGGLTARGTGVAAGFSAGMSAAMLSAGGLPSHQLHWLRLPPGSVLAVPNAWLQQLAETRIR